MEQRWQTKILQVDNMTCTSCEMRIEKVVGRLQGVKRVKAVFSSSTVEITYDANRIDLDQITATIEQEGYPVDGTTPRAATQSETTQAKDTIRINQLLGIGIILFALYMIINRTIGFNLIPEVNQSMGYGVLFAVGLLTSLHCMAMCGGINLSQCVSYKVDGSGEGKFAKLKPSLLYNGGRVISYTIVGGIVGALGSVVSFSGTAKGIVAIIAGVFMVIMGLNMLNIFPWLRKLNPRMTRFFGNKIYNNKGEYGPFYVGLLNGLMPCGPLQAMQIYALGTGSAAAGALSMFMFSLGTVPLMFGLGAISSFLSSKFTHKMLKVSAVLVIVLGVVMLNRGLALSGWSVPTAMPSISSSSIAQVEGNVQYVTTVMEDGSYTPIIVQKGVPVRWTIQADASDLNGCNNPVTIPAYNIRKKLVPGDNVIEFTPTEEGNITYTCWMGMIRSTIKVVADLNAVSDTDVQEAVTSSDDSGYAGLNGITGGGSCCGGEF